MYVKITARESSFGELPGVGSVQRDRQRSSNRKLRPANAIGSNSSHKPRRANRCLTGLNVPRQTISGRPIDCTKPSHVAAYCCTADGISTKIRPQANPADGRVSESAGRHAHPQPLAKTRRPLFPFQPSAKEARGLKGEATGKSSARNEPSALNTLPCLTHPHSRSCCQLLQLGRF